MKKILSLLLAVLLAGPLSANEPHVSEQAYRTWHRNKYSMFIHFGLYSELGGVWDGRPVTQGYSEQIQSFAGIFSDWYAETALRFNPTAFDADSIVSLARRAGMRSIVVTTKHHDGFCLWRTATTDYNTYDATPCRRDFIRELADACQRGGMRLGLYFSLIDWHYPYAYPISSHNCDFITPPHHAFNQAQVRELLTSYGPISELWFDMGSNTPEQSRELYELVHRLQPDCLVSGRVGNDQYDFAVMADNRYPDGALQCPWQSAASLFNETWGYRSWQERGSAEDKAREKLGNLIRVVSHGGNYLLNIGPKGDGSVVPFERDVLERIGRWLQQNGDAIYDTEASPFREDFAWGDVTRHGNRLYLVLTGTAPADGHIRLHTPGNRLLKAEGPVDTSQQKADEVCLHLNPEAYAETLPAVVRLTFEQPVEPQPRQMLSGRTTLTAQNATPDYSYSCFDYYSNYRSTVAYQWTIDRKTLRQMTFVYTAQEAGQTLDVDIDGKAYEVKLASEMAYGIRCCRVTAGPRYLCGPGSGLFDGPQTLNASLDKPLGWGKAWEPVRADEDTIAVQPLESYYLMQELTADEATDYLMEIGAGNGVDIFLNGHSIRKHLNPYRCIFRPETVVLPLQKGTNQLVVRLYNRFERHIVYRLRPAASQTVYRQRFTPTDLPEGRTHTIRVRKHGLASPHTDTELSNLRIEL